MNKTIFVALAAGASVQAAPTQFYQESFETPGVGYTTSVPEFELNTVGPLNDYFKVVPNDGTRRAGGVVTGGDGTRMFAAEDLDQGGGPATASVTTNAINIAGKVNTSVKILLAAPGNATGQGFYDWSGTQTDVDFVRVEASVDGGPFNRLTMFSPNLSTPLNQPLSFDANGDFLGGGVPILGAGFHEFDLPVTTGNSLQVRVVMHTNATNEYICVDNIRVFGEASASNPPSLAGVPGTALIFNEGSSAQAVAPAITVADADSANLASAVVSISANHTASEDVLAASPSGAILAGDIVFNSGAGTLTITRSASLADYQAVLRSVTYLNSNTSNPNTASRQISFQGNDGTNNSNLPIRVVELTDSIAVQNVPFTESFETDGRGTRYALDGRFTIGGAFFDRVSLTGVTNGDGTFGIAAEDTLTDSASAIKAASFLLNTAGLVNLTATVRLAAPAGNVYDTNDFIMVEASVNGGAFTTVGNFRSTGNLNFAMSQDTNGDNLGDGTALSSVMQDFTFNLPSATTLGLRVRLQSNSGGERLVADRIVVNGVAQNWSVNDVSGAEGTSPSFTVTRSVTVGADSITIGTTDGTALAASDFTAASTTLNFADGEATKTFSVATGNDSTVELDETFNVTLSSPSRGSLLDGTGVGTITNNDSSVVSIATAGSVTEGDAGTAVLTFPYSMTNAVDVAVTFDRSAAGGTATAGTDFVALAASGLSLTPGGSLSGSFQVTVNADRLTETTETIIATLANLAAGGRQVSFTGNAVSITAMGSIDDDDPLLIAAAGSLGLKPGVAGKLALAPLLAAATGGEAAAQFASVAVTSAQGGGVSRSGGFLIYDPPAGFIGADSFTYNITDGFATVNGTVNVVVTAGIGQTQNIFSIVADGAGKRMTAAGIPGRSYLWQSSEDLNTWTAIGTAQICPASGVISTQDPGPLPPTRFYRLAQAP